MKYFFEDIYYVYSTFIVCIFYQTSSTAHGFSSRENKDERGIMAPRMDYDEWTPIGRGDPLKNDPTYDYVPPVLDKVHYWISPAARTSESPIASESQIVALGTPATKKPSSSPLKPIKPSEIKRYHTEHKPHYQSYGPYISGSKHQSNRGRPQYIPLAHYHSTYKYPRPPLTMLVPPPPSQPVTYPPTTEDEYTNQMTTDLPNKNTDRTPPSTTLSLQNGQTSWKTSYPPDSTQLQTTSVQVANQENTVYYDPVKKETIYKQVSPAIDIDTTTGQTTSSGYSTSAQTSSTGQTSTTAQITTLGQPITSAQTFSTDPSSIFGQTSSIRQQPSMHTFSTMPSSTLGQTSSVRQSSTPTATVGQISTMPSLSTRTPASSLFDLLLKRDTPTSPATPIPAQTAFAAHPFLTHYKPLQEAPKTPTYLIIQGHSKVKKYGATKLDKLSGIPLQDSNEIASHQESDSNDVLKRKTRDLSIEDFLPIDESYFRSTFEDYYDSREEASGLNSIPTR